MNGKAQELFARALELPESGREGFLAKECGDDAELHLEVQRMLVDAERADSFFGDGNGATIGAEEFKDSYAEKEGDVIGPYKLLQEIGEGGFGSVWMAEQSFPIHRKVALKVIKAGMDTKQVIARFEAERQALAMMDHPNIAKVLDAGATDRGRPYFVMELVRGVPITEYCDELALGTRERLALFRDVCAAINHAHQKGIIHRDIKPSNVLVMLHGDKAVVKVIDFGIAKATQGKLTDKTLFTRFEQFIGTPVYMSPEQAAMSNLDVDRSEFPCPLFPRGYSRRDPACSDLGSFRTKTGGRTGLGSGVARARITRQLGLKEQFPDPFPSVSSHVWSDPGFHPIENNRKPRP